MQIVINAGGSGTRLWPLSTQDQPKQFVPLLDDESLLKKTVNRLLKSFQPEQIWINTNEKYKEQVIQNVGDSISLTHILTEPQKRDTFPAIAAHTAIISAHTDPDETLIFIHSDHYIPDEDAETFNQGLIRMGEALKTGQYELVISGVKPRFANTHLGYLEIHKDSIDTSLTSHTQVIRFKEKPDEVTAQSFIDSGNFFWNLGYFALTYTSLMRIVEKLYSDTGYAEALRTIHTNKTIDEPSFLKLPKEPIDTAITEKITHVGCVMMDIQWEDVGNWGIVKKYLPPIDELGENYIQIEGTNNAIKTTQPSKHIAFVGVSNLIVVDTPQGLLIADPAKSALIKKVSEHFGGK